MQVMDRENEGFVTFVLMEPRRISEETEVNPCDSRLLQLNIFNYQYVNVNLLATGQVGWLCRRGRRF